MKKLFIISLILLLSTTSYAVWPYRQKPMLGRLVDWSDPLSDGLVGLWLMNEGSGDKVFDLSGNGNTGTLTSGPIWTAGNTGPAISFDGATTYIETSMAFGYPFTMITWVNFTSVADQYIASSPTDRHNIQLVSGTLHYDNFPPSGFGATGGTTLVTNKWYQLGVTGESSSVGAKVYVNGVDDTSSSQAESISAGMTTLRFGGRAATDDMQGKMSSFMVYNRALTASEMADLFVMQFRYMQGDLPASMMFDYGAAAAPTGQVIFIQLSAIPIILAGCLLWRNREKKAT